MYQLLCVHPQHDLRKKIAAQKFIGCTWYLLCTCTVLKRTDPAKTGLAGQVHQTISPCERMRSGDETRPWATIGCEIFMSWNHRDVYHTHLIHSYHIRQKWTLQRVSLRWFELARATFVKGLTWSESWDIQLSVDREGKEFTLYSV